MTYELVIKQNFPFNFCQLMFPWWYAELWHSKLLIIMVRLEIIVCDISCTTLYA